MQRVWNVPGGILSLAVLPATASAMQANLVSLRLRAARAQPVKKANTGETVNSSARSIPKIFVLIISLRARIPY